MLARFLDWLDEAAGGLIRITYLLAGITAVAVYFGAGHLPAIVEAPLNAALPWLLAFSLPIPVIVGRMLHCTHNVRTPSVLVTPTAL